MLEISLEVGVIDRPARTVRRDRTGAELIRDRHERPVLSRARGRRSVPVHELRAAARAANAGRGDASGAAVPERLSVVPTVHAGPLGGAMSHRYGPAGGRGAEPVTDRTAEPGWEVVARVPIDGISHVALAG